MKAKTRNWLIVVVAMMFVILILFLSRDEGQRRLPRTPIPIIEANVVYSDSLARVDAPTVGGNSGFVDFQQDFRIRLNAGKKVMVETVVGWLDIEVSLYDGDKQLGELYCGYNAQCKFFADIRKDGWSILRVRGKAATDPQPFTLEVREVQSTFFRGVPSGREGILPESTVPSIDLDVVYNGTMLVSDAPLYWSGNGIVQDFQMRLNAGEPVLVQAKSDGFGIGVGVYGEGRTLDFDFDDGMSFRACMQIEVPKTGNYALRVMAPDTQDLKSGSFKLEVSKVLSSDDCETVKNSK